MTSVAPQTRQQFMDQIKANMEARKQMGTEALMEEMRTERARIEAYNKKKADEAAAARSAYWRSWLPGNKKGGRRLLRKPARRSKKTAPRKTKRSKKVSR